MTATLSAREQQRCYEQAVPEYIVEELALLLAEIIEIGLKASEAEMRFGNPISYLLRRTEAEGLHDFSRNLLESPNDEFRLNGSGLKIYVDYCPREECLSVTLFRGDQYKCYPKTGPEICEFLGC